MLDLDNLIRTLRELVTGESVEAALDELEKHLPTNVPKYNTLLQLKARQNELANESINNMALTQELVPLKNRLQFDVIAFINDLKEADFSAEAAKKANMGSVLYRIPDKMQHLKKSKCIVRVAYDESVIRDKLDMTVDVVVDTLKVAKNMEVRLVDEEGGGEYFEITSPSTPEQFLVQDEYTEWAFFVKPLDVGTYPLALIISVIIYEDGKDRKKDISLERIVNVVSQPVPEEAGDHSMRKAGILFALTDVPKAPAKGNTPKKKPWLKVAIGVMLAAALAWFLWPKLNKAALPPTGSDPIGAKEEQEYKAATEQNSPELLIGFLAQYDNSKFELAARELATKVLPKINLDSAITAYRLTNNIEPIDRDPSLVPATRTSEGSMTSTTDPPTTSEEEIPTGEPIAEPKNEDPVIPSTDPPSTDIPDKPKPGGSTPDPAVAKPTSQPPAAETPPKPEKIKWDDKLTAKEDPINWLPTTMVKVKGGRFKMGCNSKIETTGCAAFAEPSHEVKIEEFSISRFEVTQALWMAVMGERHNPSKFNDCDLCPVEHVSWSDAQDFIKKLNNQTGGSYRLPTEAEWEYAARQGGKDIRFGDGNNMAKTTNFNFNAEDMPGRRFVEVGEYRKRTVDVFSLKANAYGIYHMSGNVAEWCEDRWHTDYEGAPADGSAWLDGDDNRRVVRGGGWDTEPYASRTYDRDAKKASTDDDEVGLRLVW